MQQNKLSISLLIFITLLIFTSIVKTKTRIIEKNILEFEKKIVKINNDLHETQLDYFYLSSPKNLSMKINNLAFIEYIPMDFSRIYLNLKDFKDSNNKITILQTDDENKTKKK